MLNFKGNQKTEICGKEVKSKESQKNLGLIVTQKLPRLENAKDGSRRRQNHYF